MSDVASSNKRIAKNTIFLYFRMIVIMCITLFTSRVILQALGVEDFGIYNVVAGITTIISFLNGTLSDATQRFITFELGRARKGNINKIFSTCMILHFTLAIVVTIVLEPIGVWFISNKLQIPALRLNAALCVFHFTIIQLFVSFISVPYNALIIAHEKMSAFAMISVVEVIMKLCIAFMVMYCTSFDILIIYGLLMLMAQLILRSIYAVYCKRNFDTKLKWIYDVALIKEIGGFAAWAVVGNLSYVCVTQGVNLLLGIFFLPAVNAARGIAVQVQTAVSTFVKNFQTAINPQITKSFAAGNIHEMHLLLLRSTRFSFYLLTIVVVPILFETDIILRTWLVEVPPYTATFLRIILLSTLTNSIGNPLAVACKATGHIKYYELFAASIKLFVIPIAYIALKMRCLPVAVFIIQVIIEFLALLSNIYITHRLIGFSKKAYFQTVICNILLVSVLSSIIPIIVYIVFEDNWARFWVLISSSIIWTSTIIFTCGLSKDERQFIIRKIITHGKSRIPTQTAS